MKKVFSIIIAVLIVAGGLVIFLSGQGVFSGIPSSVEPYNESGFFYFRLNPSEKKAFDLIMREIYEFPEKIAVNPLTQTELDNVFEAVLYDTTDLFFLDESCSMKTEGTKTYFIPSYLNTREEYLKKKEELDKQVNAIVTRAMEIEDEYERELFIHNAVIEGCSYINKSGGDASGAYGCLVQGKSSCAGYARAMKMIFDKCSVENHFALGETGNSQGGTDGHIWNIIKINGSFYHVDATWDDNDVLKESKYTYFNVDDKEIQLTHSVEKRFLGECTDRKDNYFVRNGLYLTEYNEKAGNVISQKLAEFADNSQSQLAVKFADEGLYKKALTELFEKEGVYRLLVRANMLCKKELITDKVRYLCDDTHHILRIVEYYK